MMKIKGLVVLAGAAIGFGGSAALAAEPVNSDEVRAVVAEMLADAETRSSLLAGGDAGHDGKFFIAGDGFRLNVGGQVQFRYNLNFRNSNVASADDDFNGGFQTRRTRLHFDGKINKDWDFRVQGDFNRSGGSFTLLDAYARYNFANGFKVQWGQFKLPLLREELVSNAYQLAADRSLTNNVFTQSRSQGVALSYETESWRATGAVSDGLASLNTDNSLTAQVRENTSSFRVAGEAEWAITGRFEYLFAGNWKQFSDFTSPKGADFGALLGLAGHYQQSKDTENALDLDRDTVVYTADIGFKGDSWNINGAFIGRYTKFYGNTAALASNEFHDFGGKVEGGWRFAENDEFFARWDAIFVDSERLTTGDNNFHFVTGGYNHYFAGHAAKFTLDAIYAFQNSQNLRNVLGTGSGAIDSGIGLIGENARGEVAIRAQFQLLF